MNSTHGIAHAMAIFATIQPEQILINY